jgi:Asp-tRNA(Asn)/Glu-tRNA(Gln) amidotransferase A subunit family amidase
MTDPSRLTAAEALRRMAEGALTSEALVRACLGRIAEREADIRAWAWLEPDRAIAEARESDTRRRQDPGAVGPLAGLPIGVKDVIDTAEYPTQHNSALYRGHRPARDAACVAILRAAGAVVLGKTETVEFASHGRHAMTVNPRDPSRTPGGSSSGSGAAVADFMVPLALGTQTGGSVIRPGAYCGAFAFKPTHGLISLEGVKLFSYTLDTLGWYGRSAEDLALLARVFEVILGPLPPPSPMAGLRIGLCRTPYWDKAEPATREALAVAADRLAKAGARIIDAELPAGFGRLEEFKDTLTRAEGGVAFRNLDRAFPGRLSPGLKAHVDDRAARAALGAALDGAAELRPAFDAYASEFDAILTPSVPGEAPPLSLRTTGSAIFNGLWTLLHAPCVNVPGLAGPNGLPVGVQLVGPRWSDAKLLAMSEPIAAAIGGSLA